MMISIYRTIFFYFFIVVAFRIMGKREIGQLSIMDLIVSLMIAELCAISIENINDSMWLAIGPIIVLVILQVSIAYFSIKSRKFRTLVGGKSSLIINKGIINYKEMIKQRYCLDDLLLELRQNQIKSIEDVEYAYLETNGKLSIFKYNCLKIASSYPSPLVVDGRIQYDTLKIINRTEQWLKEFLIKQEVELRDVFYAFYKNRKIYLIKQSETVGIGVSKWV